MRRGLAGHHHPNLAGLAAIVFSLCALPTSAATITGANDSVQSGTTCTYVLTPQSATFTPGGASNQAFALTPEPSTCSWAAVSNADWLVVNTPTGTGPGTVTYTVLANQSSQRRSPAGIIAVGAATFTVSQTGVICTYAIVGSTTRSMSATGGTGVVNVTTSASDCPWTPSSNVSWLKVTTGAGPHFGSGSFGYEGDPNRGATSRTGRLSAVTGKTVTITQPAAHL